MYSYATVNVTADLNGTLVLCRDPTGTYTVNHNITIYIIGEHSELQCIVIRYAYPALVYMRAITGGK